MQNDPIQRYHQQRDALVGRKADHLTPPTTYSRGALPAPDSRPRYAPKLREALKALGALLLLIGFLAALVIIAEFVRQL
jgi:hypothetical protein